MPSSPTPGSPTSICSRTSMPTWPSPFDHRLGTPKIPAIRSARASPFRGFTGSLPLRPARLLAPLYGIRLDRPAFGDFYFQAFNGSVSLSVAGYNYNSGWISFCWRDLHPLEWQLASLHGQKAKCSLRADVFRCSPNNGHYQDTSVCPFGARIGSRDLWFRAKAIRPAQHDFAALFRDPSQGG